MQEPPMTDPLAELRASAARRFIGVGTMFGLGALLLWLGLSQAFDNVLWQVFVIACAGVALFAGMRMQQATALHIELHEDGVYDSDGVLLAALDDIETVERGMLAFKPSNGFMIRTKTPQARRWRPGLYWIMGRRVGVGGVTAASHSKVMADIIALKLRERAGEPSMF